MFGIPFFTAKSPARPARRACKRPSQPLRGRRLRHEPLEDRRLLSLDPGWLVTIGSDLADQAHDVALDEAGNIFVVGQFYGTVDFDPANFHPGNADVLTATRYDAFVAKYLPDGTLAWVGQIVGAASGYGYGIALDSAGNVYVAGQFMGQVDCDPDPNETVLFTSPDNNDIFVVKLTGDGDLEWAQRAGASYADDIAVDSEGNVYVAGIAGGATADFGEFVIEPTRNSVAYVAKMDPDGNFTWVNQIGSPTDTLYHDARACGVAVDNGDPSTGRPEAVYLTGRFAGTCEFGQDIDGNTVTLTSQVGETSYFMKMNADGKVQWVEALDGTASAYPSVAVDEDGTVFVAGGFKGTVSLYGTQGEIAPEILTSAGEYDAFVLKLDSAGGLSAAQRLGGPAIDAGCSIAVGAGQVYVTGIFETTAAFGDVSLTSAGEYDVFITALDAADLSPIWAQRAGGPEGEDYGALGVAVDSDGFVYTIGAFRDTASFPTGEVRTSAGYDDMFLLKLNPALRTISGNVFADLNNNGINDDGAGVLEGWTVYLDLNRDGWLGPDEPTATTVGPGGTFLFGNLEPDTYRVAQQVQPRWTETLEPQEVDVTDNDVADVELGAYVPTATKTYLVEGKGNIPEEGYLWWTMILSDPYTILDVNIGVNVTHSQLSDTFMGVAGPDGHGVSLVPRNSLTGADFNGTVFDDEASLSIFEGSAPFDGSTDASGGAYRPDTPLSVFDHGTVAGEWTLRIDDHEKNRERGTIWGWWLEVTYIVPEGENIPPLAVEDTYLIDEDGTLSVNAAGGVLANDSDPDGDPQALTAVLVDAPSNGSVTLSPDGSFVYQPDPDFNGTDSFTYVANDGQDDSNEATVTITVDPVHDGGPTAEAGGPYTVPAGGTVVLDASGTTDPDLPFETLTYEWDFDNDGLFDDATGESPTFDAGELSAGDSVTVGLRVTDSAASTSTDTATITAEQASERIYTSTDGPINIGDLKTVTSTVLATYSDQIVALNVQINLTHDSVSDLTVRLLDPNGVSLELASPIQSGEVTYDVVIPVGTTLQHAGTWTLEITDGAKNRQRGTLYEWSLIVNPAPTEGATASATSAIDLALLAWLEPDSSDDDESDLLTTLAADDLAMLLVE